MENWTPNLYDLILCRGPTLYERLGGVYPVASVVDDFIGRMVIDPRLNANPHRHRRRARSGRNSVAPQTFARFFRSRFPLDRLALQIANASQKTR